MKSKKSLEWIEEGYQVVANGGFERLSIEEMARSIGKNKSSFYHYFGDLDLFKQDLLAHHIEQGKVFAAEAAEISNIYPEMIQLFIERKTDMFFHKQLRLNREQDAYRACFEKAYEMIAANALDSYIEFLGFQKHRPWARAFLHLIFENFLLRITPNNYSHEWMAAYLNEIRMMTNQINIEYK